MTRLLLTALFLEAGGALIVVPWSTFWDRNYFAQLLPVVEVFITNDFVRGAVSGIGVVNVAVGVRELVSMILATRTTYVTTLTNQHAPDE